MRSFRLWIISGLVLTTLVLATVAGRALAQDRQAESQEAGATAVLEGWGPAFLDEDGDGVCDYWPQGRRGRGGGWGRGQGQGPAMVDEDGDGVCDYWPQGRRGRGGGWGRGQGQGPAMVDEDGDGVCDYWAQGRRGRRAGWGRGQGRRARVSD